MGNTVRQRSRPVVVEPIAATRQISLNDRIAAIAELGTQTLAAERCAVAYQSGAATADEVACAPRGDSQWDEPLNAILAALNTRLIDAPAARTAKRARAAAPGSIESIARVGLSAGEIEAIARAKKVSEAHQLAASAFTNGAGTVRIAMVARADRAPAEVDASLGLVARAVLGEIALAGTNASLEFWRNHGADNGRQASGARRTLLEERAALNYLDEAVALARRAPPSERFARFGQLVASGAGFDQWIVAIADAGSFFVAASSSDQKQFNLGEGSALSESFRRRIVIARWRDRNESAVVRDAQYFEDSMFGGPYVCIPFEAGAIALASRNSKASASKAETIVERLAPFAAIWVLEREAERRSRLVRQLALRMFAAIDEERARIARDLHDDQAQLLAAAKLALDGPREQARSIFKQVEQELRRKTRELRPATTGGALLDEAIRQEFSRLTSAGVKTRLILGAAAEKISRPVQQICFQVVREALSNVIKHSHATSVEVTIESSATAARVSVADDGCGFTAGRHEGLGLTGIRERLELMGGRLTLESIAGATILVAEIPESA